MGQVSGVLVPVDRGGGRGIGVVVVLLCTTWVGLFTCIAPWGTLMLTSRFP